MSDKQTSYKQQLLDLHQLLAQVRFHAMDEIGLSAEISNLSTYAEVGITSLDLDADIETQRDAILALAGDLATMFEQAQMDVPARPSEKTTTAAVTGPTEMQTFHDLAEGTSETVEIEAQQTPEPASASVDETTEPPKVIGGSYTRDETEVPEVELCDTSLQDDWASVKEREDRKPVETWGSEEPAEAGANPEVELFVDEEDGVTQTQLAVDVETKAQEDEPVKPEEVGEQMTLPTA